MLKAGIVGLGWWGRIITATLSDSSRLKLAAAADIDPAAEKFASAHSLSFTTDTDALLVNPEIDAVLLCTPRRTLLPTRRAVVPRRGTASCSSPAAITGTASRRAGTASVTAQAGRPVPGHAALWRPYDRQRRALGRPAAYYLPGNTIRRTGCGKPSQNHRLARTGYVVAGKLSGAGSGSCA